ncbi:MAG: alcohol dehydrogenase catalytic domain-containing protein [Anaerolineae bacterium]|jgi:L-iditol 2-dehydrogenase|nr:alcohol dehydrogenase catalytic domain-containing protein [Anaerolineae bacterium]
MKAAFLVGKRVYRVREAPDPVAPEDGIVLAVEACGVCGSDLRRWHEGPPDGPGSIVGLPGIIAGHEVGGTVVAAGRAVRDYAVGDRLAVAPDIHCGSCFYCRRGLYNLCDSLHFLGISPGYPGGFAERLILTHEVLTLGIVHRIPEGLSSLHAALAEPLSSVLACHDKAGTDLDHTVVVMGAGPIGCLHVAIAKSRGARVIISEPSETRLAMARRFRPDAALSETGEAFVAQVRALTEGRGADIVICANPVAATQAQAVEAVRKGGRVVLFGGLPKATPMTTLDANRIHYGDIEVVGAFSYHPTMHALALDVLSRRLIPADDLITHTYPLDEIATAFEVASTGEGLKVVITP